MKKTVTLFILVALIACGGGKNEKAAENASSQKSETTNAEMPAADADNPFETLIANYSPQQLKRLLGKTEPEDVRDFLVLLPDSICYDHSPADRLKIIQGECAGNFGGMVLEDVDIANGYLSLSAWEGTWEMFAKKEDNVWLIAVNQQFCGEICYTHVANNYTFIDGKLTELHYANLAGYQDVYAELFLDFNQLTKEQQNTAKQIWEEAMEESSISIVLFRLPRDGKTITMYTDALPFINGGIPKEALKKVTETIWE